MPERRKIKTMIKRSFTGVLSLFAVLTSLAQGPVPQTFKDTRVVNGHSVETSDLGEMKFIISHRFGYVNTGAYEVFGLDQSTIRIGLDYGITDNFTVGAGRSSFEKTFDGFVKYRLLRQKSGEKKFPFSLTAMSSTALTTLKWAEPERENYFTSRLTYAHQILIARKFSDAFSWQIMPTLLHRNIVPTSDVAHDVYAIGSATRLQLTKTLSVQTEYYYTLPGQLEDGYRNSLSIGVDIETKGHVFQLHVSNSRGMIEKFFIGNTTGQWDKGDVSIGFNITRDFRLRGRG